MSSTLIVVGILVIAYPFLTEAYGYFVQRNLNQQWEIQAAAQERQALQARESQRLRLGDRTVATEDTVLKEATGPSAQAGNQELPPTKILIPKIGVEQVVMAGVGPEVLQNGPGHYTGTPLPGQNGNVGIAGHRVTFTHPFNRLDELMPGDKIILETLENTYEYGVVWSKTLDPSDLTALAPTKDARVTLTTCTPKYSAKSRLDVQAKLVKVTPRRPPTLFHRLLKKMTKVKEEPLPDTIMELTVSQGREGVTNNPTDPEARIYLGAVYRNIGRYDEAIAQLNKAIELDRQRPDAYYELALVYEKTGRTPEAIEALNATIARNSLYEAAYYRLGMIYLRTDQTDRAVDILKRASALSPMSADTHFYLGQAYERQGQTDLAGDEYREALRFIPDFPEARDALIRLNKK